MTHKTFALADNDRNTLLAHLRDHRSMPPKSVGFTEKDVLLALLMPVIKDMRHRYGETLAGLGVDIDSPATFLPLLSRMARVLLDVDRG